MSRDMGESEEPKRRSLSEDPRALNDREMLMLVYGAVFAIDAPTPGWELIKTELQKHLFGTPFEDVHVSGPISPNPKYCRHTNYSEKREDHRTIKICLRCGVQV